MRALVSSAPLLLGLFYFFYFALVGIYIIFLPKMLHQLGYSGSQIGAIFAAAPMMRFLLPFLFRRFGRLGSRIYLLSLAATLLTVSGFFFTIHSFGPFLFLNLLYGAAMGIVLPYVDTIALRLVTPERYGRVRLWGSLGFMAIALWLGKVLHTPNQSLFYLLFTALATLLTGLLLVRYDRNEPPVESAGGRKLCLRCHWAFWLSAFLLQVSFGAFYNFFTIYETAHGIDLETVSWLWSFGVVCEILMLYFQGPLLRHDLLRLLELSVLTAVLRWSLLWLWPDSLAVAYLSQSLHAFNFALYYTAAIAYVYDLYREKKLAQQFFLGITFGLGGSLGALIAGRIYDRAPDWLFASQALFALAAWAALLVHRRRRKARV